MSENYDVANNFGIQKINDVENKLLQKELKNLDCESICQA